MCRLRRSLLQIALGGLLAWIPPILVACSGDGDPSATDIDAGTVDAGTGDGFDAGDPSDARAPNDAGDRDAGADPGEWTAIAVTRVEPAASIAVGGEMIPARGSADQWLPILAMTDTPEAVSWISGISFSGTLPSNGPDVRAYRVAVDPDTRDVYVAFSVRAVDGAEPMTIELTGPEGAVEATATTAADVSGLAALYLEPFLAKLDSDGAPVWLKRLAQGTGEAECTSALALAVNAEGNEVMVAVNSQNLTDRSVGGSAPLTFGPGDPGAIVYDVPNNQRVNVTLLLDPDTGELRHIDVLGDRTTSYGGVNGGWNFPSAAMLYDETGERYAAVGGISNFRVTDVAFSLQGASPVPVPQPGPEGYCAIWGTFAAADLAVGFSGAAAGNTASDVGRFTYPLSDGGVLVSGYIASTRDATFSSRSGPQVFTGGEDGTGWLALYDGDGDVVWAKPALAGANERATLSWTSAVDDPGDGAVFVWGNLTGSTAVTLGAGEKGEVTFADLSSAQRHGVLVRFHRGSGELVWARLLEGTSSSPDVNLLGLLFRGADDSLEIRWTGSGTVDVAGTVQELGSGVSWLRTRFTEDGTMLESDELLHPTDGGGVSIFVTDLAP